MLQSMNGLLFVVVCAAKDGKKVREKIRKLASKVESDDFSGDLEMVRTSLLTLLLFIISLTGCFADQLWDREGCQAVFVAACCGGLVVKCIASLSKVWEFGAGSILSRARQPTQLAVSSSLQSGEWEAAVWLRKVTCAYDYVFKTVHMMARYKFAYFTLLVLLTNSEIARGVGLSFADQSEGC